MAWFSFAAGGIPAGTTSELPGMRTSWASIYKYDFLRQTLPEIFGNLLPTERGGTQKGTEESEFTTEGTESTEEGTTEYSEYTEGEHKTGWQVHCEHHSGQLRRETSQAKAERIVGEELRLALRKPERYWFSCVFYA